MPRRKRLRKVVEPPKFKGYKPYGGIKNPTEHIDLLYEEYESIKLADYNNLNHHEASILMGISRPTFARIYEDARKKIAKALVEVKEIRTVYGNAILDKNWFVCTSCEANFNIPTNIGNAMCPLCKSENIDTLKNQAQ
jgi:predicted DNA-binding protein (UPF0251 family)